MTTYKTQGWYLPKNSYTGSMDVTLSSSSLLSVRGGYFWDNYIDNNPPAKHQTRYNVIGSRPAVCRFRRLCNSPMATSMCR